MKALVKIGSIVFVLLLVAGVYIYLHFSDLAKNAAEKVASNALGVKVTISSLDVSLKEKKAVLHGLKIANPPGYKKPYIITADKLHVELKAASKELVDINFVKVDGTVVNLEVNETGVNIQDLRNLAQQKKQRESVGSKQVRVIARKIVINTSTLNSSVSVLDKDLASLEIRPININGLGTGSNGKPAGQAVTEVMTIFVQEVEKAANRAGYLSADGVVNQFKDAIGNAKRDIKKLFD